MKKIVALLFLALLIVAAGFVYKERHATVPSTTATDTQAQKTLDYTVPVLTQEYKNDMYRFSLMLPQNFTVRTIPSETGATYVFQDDTGNGIQVLITPAAKNSTNLSVAEVRGAIRDMQITDDQIIDIGDTNKGVAFKSDNEAFGGASREVWFYFHGNLYQISTYARLDPLLKSMFATWKFF